MGDRVVPAGQSIVRANHGVEIGGKRDSHPSPNSHTNDSARRRCGRRNDLGQKDEYMHTIIACLFVILFSMPAAAQAPVMVQEQTAPSLLAARNPRSDGFRL